MSLGENNSSPKLHCTSEKVGRNTSANFGHDDSQAASPGRILYGIQLEVFIDPRWDSLAILHSSVSWLLIPQKTFLYSGLWNPYDDYRRWWYYVYCGIIAFGVVTVRVVGYSKHAWVALTQHNDFVSFTLSGSLVIGFGCTMLKFANLLWNMSEVKFIVRTCGWEVTIPCFEETGNFLQTRVFMVTGLFIF